MADTLDTKRATFAASTLLGDVGGGEAGRFGPAWGARFAEPTTKEAATSELRKYRSFVLSAGTYLRQCGLLQLAAFALSKGGADKEVLSEILSWLVRSDVTASVCQAHNGMGAITGEQGLVSFSALTARTTDELRLLESEADAILGWLKRLTVAKALDAGIGEDSE